MTEQQLPDGWQMVKFGDIAKHISKRVEPSETDLEIYVGLEHLDPDSLKIKHHGVPSDVAGQKLLVKKGQIIFGKRRAYQRKVAVADWDCICSAHAMVLEANPKNVLPEFLPFFMQSDVFMNRAVAISEGSLSPTIKWKSLAAQSFSIPSKEEQRKIVKACSLAVENFNQLDQVFDAFDSVFLKTLRSLFDELNDYKKQKLSNIASVEYGISDPIDKGLSEGVKMITLPCVDQNCVLTLDETKIAYVPPENVDEDDFLKKGDILFNWRNGSPDHIGKSVYIEKNLNFVHVGFLLRVRLSEFDEMLNYYVWLYLLYLKKMNSLRAPRARLTKPSIKVS